MTDITASRAPSFSLISLPILFIILWSSGYIGGAIGIHYAEPFTMTFLRFASAGLILLLVATATKAPWPKSWKQVGHVAIVGFCMQAVQFGGLYSGMRLGVPAGESALIVGMMPIFVALGASRFLSERVTRWQWIGLALGLSGVAIVLWQRLGGGNAGLSGYGCSALALTGITAGTLYQKRFCGGIDLRTGGCIQMAVGASVMLAMALTTETMTINWTTAFVGSVAWLAVMNSIGALSLLYLMIRRGEATKAAALFYLIPPVTQIMASTLLAEIPSLAAVIGFGLAGTGVYLANRR